MDCLQTLKDNLQLFTSQAIDIHSLIRGLCDSFVLKTGIYFPTDINLLYDATRVLIQECIKWNKDFTLLGWRHQYRYNLVYLKGYIEKFKNCVTQRPKKTEFK